MNKTVENYIKYGLLNNKIYFPHDKSTINRYIEKNSNFKSLILQSNKQEILNYAQKNTDNIFILSYFVYVFEDVEESYLEYLLSLLNNEIDVYMFSYFVMNIENKNKQKRIINKVLNKKDYKAFLFEQALIKNNVSTKGEFAKERRKALNEIKEKMYSGTFLVNDIQIVKKHNIHPDELSYYLSYTLDLEAKTELFKHFLNTFSVKDMLFVVDNSFQQDIPFDVESLLSEKIYNASKIEDMVFLFIYRKKLNNLALKSIVRKALTNLNIKSFETRKIDDIRIYINPKYTIYTDKEDKINYQHYLSVFAVILSSAFGIPLYINDEKIINSSILDKINIVKEYNSTINGSSTVGDDHNSFVIGDLPTVSPIRWNLLDNFGDDTSGQLIVSGINIKTFIEVINYLQGE